MDADDDEATWVSTYPVMGKWNRRYFAEGGKRDKVPLMYPGSQRKLLQAPAPLVTTEPPELEVVDEEMLRRRRDVTFTLQLPPEARGADFWLPSGMSRLVVEGENLGGGFDKVRILGSPPEGIKIECRIPKSRLELRVVSIQDGLPEEALGEPVPDWVIPRANLSDLIQHATLVSKTLEIPAAIEEEGNDPDGEQEETPENP